MNVAVIGLGYVGLPLAIALAEKHNITGFDIDRSRVGELASGHDRTGEITAERLGASSIQLTDDPDATAGADVFIVTVPTPVNAANEPDLGAIVAASGTVGRQMAPGAIVVFESTVWPGVTEEICGPELERTSGLKAGADFFLGYSPERINPGDREHTIERITKVIAGQTPEVTERLAELYGAITSGGVFAARDIRTAEAAKVIENAQRDINIAFINEVAQICQKLDISTHDVLDAAGTKWNFLDFRPGLVGGHCIGVDPYYLAHRARALGHEPHVILSGRNINDAMGTYVADAVNDRIKDNARVLVLGLTFKEDVPDLRNSQVGDIMRRLEAHGHTVVVHDPQAVPEEAREIYGIDLADDLTAGAPFNCVIGAVAHAEYRGLGPADLAALLTPEGLLADIKGMWRTTELPANIRRWTL